jgi:DNA-directed RNA polymerase specialized sigma24 family protein
MIFFMGDAAYFAGLRLRGTVAPFDRGEKTMASSDTSGTITQAMKDLGPGGVAGRKTAAKNEIVDRFFQDLVARLRARFPRHEDAAVEGAESAFRVVFGLIEEARYEWLVSRGSLWALLLQIAGRKALNKLRDQTRQTKHLVAAADLTGAAEGNAFGAEGVGGPPSQVGASWESLVLALLEKAKDEPSSPERQAVVEAAAELIGKCDAKLRLAEILLWRMEGHDDAEIARRIGRSVKTVQYRLNLIRDSLLREGRE